MNSRILDKTYKFGVTKQKLNLDLNNIIVKLNHPIFLLFI